jgi:hypothetical protein
MMNYTHILIRTTHFGIHLTYELGLFLHITERPCTVKVVTWKRASNSLWSAWKLFFCHLGFKVWWCQAIALASCGKLWVEPSWNVMAHGDAREGKWGGNWRMEWVDSTLHTTSERGVSSITTADAHTAAASSRLNWRSRRFKWTRPFRRKMKSGFCACAITFQTQFTSCCAHAF